MCHPTLSVSLPCPSVLRPALSCVTTHSSLAGVSAAFDAPATGALFAIEFVLKSSRLGLDRLSTSTVFAATSVSAGVVGFLRGQGQALGITGAATHLVGRIPYFSINPNLLTDVLQVIREECLCLLRVSVLVCCVCVHAGLCSQHAYA